MITINQFADLPGVVTVMTGSKPDRLQVRQVMGCDYRSRCKGAFAVDDGIVGYLTDEAGDAAFARRKELQS